MRDGVLSLNGVSLERKENLHTGNRGLRTKGDTNTNALPTKSKLTRTTSSVLKMNDGFFAYKELLSTQCSRTFRVNKL